MISQYTVKHKYKRSYFKMELSMEPPMMQDDMERLRDLVDQIETLIMPNLEVNEALDEVAAELPTVLEDTPDEA